MLRESPRLPHPINWDEQERIFRRLPDHLARMALFAVNTGLRDANLCGLQWSWEVPIAELGRSVFVVPAQAFKSRRAHVVILNDAAWSIIETQRGKHPVWVFSYRGERVERMNNTAWQRARREAKLTDVRVHDLRHTFATRLRAAGVAEEDRAALLGHATRTMPEHYASADVGRLVGLANRVLDRVGTVTILRVANGDATRNGAMRDPNLWIKGRADGASIWLRGAKPLKTGAPGRVRTHDPSEAPNRLARSMPTASITARISSARSSSVAILTGRSDSPVPRLSNRIRRQKRLNRS